MERIGIGKHGNSETLRVHWPKRRLGALPVDLRAKATNKATYTSPLKTSPSVLGAGFGVDHFHPCLNFIGPRFIHPWAEVRYHIRGIVDLGQLIGLSSNGKMPPTERDTSRCVSTLTPQRGAISVTHGEENREPMSITMGVMSALHSSSWTYHGWRLNLPSG